MGKFDKQFFVKLLAEFLGSMFMQFVGCSIHHILFGSVTMYAMGWGGAVLAATQMFRIVSGAHLNPCISIAAMIVQNVEIVDGFLYILMQLIGSALGFGAAFGVTKYESKLSKLVKKKNMFCVTVVTIEPWWKSFLLEFYMTGAWVLAMCASWHSSNEDLLESISLRIGLVVTAAALAGGYPTGASMNPFRSLWPAIAAGYYEYIYIYMVVPPITAILLALAWRFLYCYGEDQKKAEE